MSITSLSFDVSAPLTHTRPVERKDGGSENLSAAVLALGQRKEEVGEKIEGLVKGEESKPVINVLESALEFSQDQETGVVVVRMYDRTSGELIRQLPPEETLTLLRHLAEENKKGVLVSKKL
jgi:flagellar protein FlaG